MFTPSNSEGFTPLIPGISIKVVGYGEKTLTAMFLLDAGSLLPLHDHVYEQTGTLLEGEMELSIGDETFAVYPGDVWTIPPNVSHKAKVVKDSKVLEVFSPPREDYLRKVGIISD